ncbi:hypothetical protein ACP275_03G035400 [Erythranthe tilingii]
MELCRERLGVNWCDKRRSISEYTTLFPAIDFSLIESDDDTLWELDVRETNEDIARRGLKFLNWLWSREEREIAVVTHSALLMHTLTAFGDDCHPSVKAEICKPFKNCELRPLVIVDRSMIGSSSTKTNYPGKIPRGTDPQNVDPKEKSGEGNCGIIRMKAATKMKALVKKLKVKKKEASSSLEEIHIFDFL